MVGHGKDGFFGELLFQLVECVLAVLCPFKFVVFLQEVIQWFGNFGEVSNESSVEVSKPKNPRTCLTVVGLGHSEIPLSFPGSMEIFPSSMIIPSHSTFVF
jgi:hypothetical protein